jgi:hypothetical protein
MANQQRRARNIPMPEDADESWRPEDEDQPHERERFMARDRERMGPQWDDRSGRWDDRFDRQRSTEYYGQGQSGYAAGRDERDRSYGSRNQRYPGDERSSVDRGTDERFVGGRGGGPWSPRDEQRTYGGGGYLGQAGQEMGYGDQRSSTGRQTSGRPGGHRGKGPSGYTRSDERIREQVCEALTDEDDVDATHIDVSVHNGEVVLSGTVEDRQQKRRAEDCIEHVWGVKDVVNQLRIAQSDPTYASSGPSATSSRDNGKPEPSSTEKRHRA